MRSFRELVGMEDVLLVLWYLLLHLKSWIHHSLKSSSKSVANNASAKQQPQQQQQQKQSCPSIDECRASSDSLVCELEGALLRSSSPFAYLFLVAFEAGGGFPRAALLLAAYPLVWLLGVLISPVLAFRVLVFISLCGVRESALAKVARAVLPKFYLGDLHPGALRVLTASGSRRCVVTSSPRKMVEPFLKDFLDVELVVGSELSVTWGGYLTGLLASRPALSDQVRAPVGIGVAAVAGDVTGISTICKEAYVVRDAESVAAVASNQLPKPVIFHDGRFAIRPTPVAALVVFLWLPLGLVLAVPRMLVAVLCPNVPLIGVLEALLGIRIRTQGKPPKPCGGQGKSSGVLFVCTHRMLVDPLFLSLCAGRRVMAVTYSISWISEALAPIRTLRLTRCRDRDAKAIAAQLAVGDLAVCPEGTTCREPYLLRFSPLFAELSDKIVPVAVSTKSQFFHGSTARGWKALDPLFFLLNPFPSYHVQFLDMLPPEATVQHGGASSIDVANHVQRLLAETLGYQCTSYSRRDKYQLLAGNDGVVEQQEAGTPARSRLHRYFAGWRR